jgi:transposase
VAAKRSASKPSSTKSSKTSRPVRQRRDFAALERRRRKAARLFAKGVPQAEVARRLNMSRQSVSRWYQRWIKRGEDALVGTKS